MHDFTLFERSSHARRTFFREYAAGSIGTGAIWSKKMQEHIEVLFVVALAIVILVPIVVGTEILTTLAMLA